MKKIILLPAILIFIIFGCAKVEENTPDKSIEDGLIETSAEEGIDLVENKTLGQVENPNEEPEKNSESPAEGLKETQTEWPTFHGDLRRTGFSSSKAPSKASVLWKWTIKNFMDIGYDKSFDTNWPIIHDDNVFIAAGNIFAFNLETGKLLWKFSENDNFYPRGLAAGDGKIFATVNNDDNMDAVSTGFIYAFDEKTGKVIWKYKTDKGLPYSLPLYAEGMVFVGDNSGNVYATNANNGNLIWKKKMQGASVIHSSPAYEGKVLFIGTEDSIGPSSKPSHLYALDANNGEVKWEYTIDVVPGKLNLIHSTPSVSDGVVYIGAENGYFYAIDAKDGSLIWKQKIASGSGEIIGTSAAAALGYGKAFIGTFDGKFLALDQKDGKVAWQYDFGKGTADSSPVLADNKVYFGSGQGYFYSFNADDGSVIWKEKLGGTSGALASGILVAQNTLAEENFKEDTPLIIAFSDEGKLQLWN